MKKIKLILLLLLFSYTYSQDTLKINNIEEVALIKKNSYKNSQNFKEKFHSQKYNYSRWKAKIVGKSESEDDKQVLDGEFILSPFLGVKSYILNVTNNDASSHQINLLKNIIDISYNTMRIFSKDLKDGFYCKKINETHWEFFLIDEKLKNKLKLNKEDSAHLKIEIDNFGKLTAIESKVNSENYKYYLIINFSKSIGNLLAFENIKFKSETKSIKNDINIEFFKPN